MTGRQEPSAVSYVEAAGTGGWFADLHGADGRFIETGLGRSQDEALEHLSARLERNTEVQGEPEVEAAP
jgi:hypothetical protein